MSYINSTKEIDNLNFPLYLSDARGFNSIMYEFKVTKSANNKYHITGVEFSHKSGGLIQIANFIDRKITKENLKQIINHVHREGEFDFLPDRERRGKIKSIFNAKQIIIRENDLPV